VRTVHKDRSLDLVGWFTLMPSAGPAPNVLAIHTQILDNLNDAAVLLGFSPAELLKARAGGRLPIAVYESNYEPDASTAAATNDDGQDTTMADGTKAQQQPPKLCLKFRELPYTVETDEAEMISMAHVAQGGANASATPIQQQRQLGKQAKQKSPEHPRGSEHDHTNASKQMPIPADPANRMKRRAVEMTQGHDAASESSGSVAASSSKAQERKPEVEQRASDTLRLDEEETIVALTTKANAVMMLQSRIRLLISYLDALPQSCSPDEEMTDAPGGPDATASTDATTATPEASVPVQPSASILRRLQALVTRLHLVVPSDVDAFRAEIARESDAVQLMVRLGGVVEHISAAWEVGKRYAIVEQSRLKARSFESEWAGHGRDGFPAQDSRAGSSRDANYNSERFSRLSAMGFV